MSTPPAAKKRLPLNLFGIAFGTAGLSGTWTAANALLGAPVVIAEILWVAAAIAWVVLTVNYLRGAGSIRAIGEDFRHPVLGPFAALFPAIGSLLAAHLEPIAPAVAAVGVWVMAALATAIGGWFMALLLTQPRAPEALHGGYLLPTVAGSLIAAQSLAVIGQTDFAIGFLAVGVLFWMLVGAVLLVRFTTGPAIPAGLLPTLLIFSAPPAVAGNALWAITGGGNNVFVPILGALMIALLLPHLFLVRRYAQAGFTLGFWAMTFTVAASATYGIRLLSLAPASVAAVAGSWVIVAAATLFIGAIAVRSLATVPRNPRRTTIEISEAVQS